MRQHSYRYECPPGRYVLGLDLSLRAAAACIVPLDWDGASLGQLRTCVVGEALANDADECMRLGRLHHIAEGLVAFCRAHGVKHAFVEQYAFSQTGAHARSIAEVGGVVKYRLFRKLGIVCEPVVASSARKLLLTKCPKKDVKKFVVKNVRRLGGTAREWTEDEVDAFVVANMGMYLVGKPHMNFDGIP